ncbi:hypothetical protein WL40_12565 [Burkholderia ubonensis]|uniref:fimbria/pilus periplasmic chaperone n=1 Tax=Burkholderia ubonensis TaxID=101571 RepID=UPI0007586B7D|nr:fimbria/pilus periplasmic chaperone [Burkholderia ubonensis]KWB69839.1 hypothetical protein WL40_12565 [Burkholderia ubonensis]
MHPQTFLRRSLVATACILALTLSSATWAGVVLGGTRVVYPSQNREVSVRVMNEGKHAALVQAWLDLGDPQAKPEDIEVPFTLMPPVFRLDPGKGQTMRLVYTKEPLPQDRESVFWLNVLEIPPKASDGNGQNHLQVAYRTRVKVFFRPAGLTGRPEQAAQQLSWSLTRSADDEHVFRLKADNPTPYAVSFAGIVLKAGDREVARTNGMVKPKQSVTFALKGLTAAPKAPMHVTYHYINDYGADAEGTAAVK